ncbi:RNA polymerase sigma factor [Candidatus Allofournierella merdipullorum]|uniref:RNA polymerase sigma factor n=1 Tax=Candidatus Allofournierella merdipullorum TaxID=2838595 RepID=UPI002A88CAA5|nr:RNA polymerase sigma factor [Candidatus Fournierella merdipullorum]
MAPRPGISPAAAQAAVEAHGDRLFRLCLVLLGSTADAEDAVQETLLKYLQKAPAFETPEHEKAWLLRVAANHCRDVHRRRARQPQTPLEELDLSAPDAEGREMLDALMALPEKFRAVLVLHYVEGYRVEEVAKIIGRTPSAVKMRLQKGRRLLAQQYGKEGAGNGI